MTMKPQNDVSIDDMIRQMSRGDLVAIVRRELIRRQRVRESRLGKKFTPEQSAKLSASLRKTHAKRRAERALESNGDTERSAASNDGLSSITRENDDRGG